MTNSQNTQSSPSAGPGYDLTRDEIYETLSNRRRRYALHRLRQQDESVTLSDLATQIADWERDGTAGVDASKKRKHVYTALQQFHLPKMAEMGIVVYDPDEGRVELTAVGADLDVYLDVVRGSDVPWSLYYVGFAAVSTALVAVAAADIEPVALLPDIAWGAFLVVALSISALAHLYDTRRKKLGAAGPPPEVGR